VPEDSRHNFFVRQTPPDEHIQVRTGLRRKIKECGFTVIALGIGFLLIEGLSSFALFTNEALFRSRLPVAERVHTQYDSELGWVNAPDLYIENMYAPGISLKTNSQSFRNHENFNTKVPDRRIRIICSGDSFTFGYGVDDDHTWCQLLRSFDARFETINMGVGGYGLDQSYLLYQRAGQRLEHDIHVFAFITDDFRRMQSDTFSGYHKPVLRLKEGVLVTQGIPVPKRSYYLPWITQNIDLFENLRSFEVVSKILGKIFPPGQAKALGEDQVRDVVMKIFEELHRQNNEKNSALVLLYLPIKRDFKSEESDKWREFLRVQAGCRGIPFVDLIEKYRTLSQEKIDELFLRTGDVYDFPGAPGHYSVKGNDYVGRALYQKLLELSEEKPVTLDLQILHRQFADDKPFDQGKRRS
jgi:hypothetical protein